MEENNTNWLLIVVALIVLGIIGYAVYAMTTPGQEIALDGGQEQQEQQDQAQNDTTEIDEELDLNEEGVTPADILDNPDEYIGQTVTVEAEVEEWINPRVIVLDAAGVVNDTLLVITQEPTLAFEDPAIFGDDIWRVQGTVTELIAVEAIDTYDLDFEADVIAAYESEPFIAATSMTQITE